MHARNLADAAQDVVVSVLGLESAWLPGPVRVPGVPADHTASVELALLPSPGSAPGDYPFVVVVQCLPTGGVGSGSASAASPAPATTLVDAQLRVDGASELVVTVEPAEARAVRRRTVQVVLANTGDQPARVVLAAAAELPDELAVRVRTEAGDGGDGGAGTAGTGRAGAGDGVELLVAPHTAVRLPARARVARPRLAGAERRLAYHVTATGSRAPRRFDAAVTARPFFTSGVLKVVAVTACAALWIGLVAAALPWLSDRFDPSRDDLATAQEAAGGGAAAGDDQGGGGDGAAAPDEGGGGDGGSGDGGGGAGGGGSAGGGAATTPAETPVRVGGVVTSSEPAGVTVQVVPAATVDPPPAQGASAEPAGVLSGALPWLPLGAAVAGGHAVALLHRARAAPVGKVPAALLPVERTDETSRRRSTVTGDDGSWAFGGLSPTGRYLIVLSKPGYQTQRYWVTGAQAATAPLEIEMVPGQGRLSGTATGPGGPAGGVEIRLSDGTTTVTTRTATSGRVGFWAVDGLSTPSTYLVSASSERLGAQAALVRLAAAGERSVALRLRSGVTTLSGTVSGRDSLGGTGGLGGITVTARKGDVSRTATTATGDHAGAFVLPDLPVPGRYTVTFAGEGYATQTRAVRLTAAGSSPLRVTLTAVGGTVSGSVTDDAGAGVAAAGLTLTGPAGTFKTMSASDARGSFLMVGIAPGKYVLTAESFGHEPASTQVTVVSGRPSTADLVLTRLPGDGLVATSFIRGRVTDASTGARITCPKLLPGEACELTVTTTATDPDGTARNLRVTADPDDAYQVPSPGERGLYPGRYRLILQAPGYEPGHVDVTVPMGQVVEAATVALLPSPSIVGSVSARVGTVPTDTCVVAVAPGAAAPDPSACRPDATGDECESDVGRCSFLGVNGSYEIDRLRSGAYDVHVVPPTGSEFLAPAPVRVVLTPGDVRRLDATLDRLGRLSLTVLASDGAGTVLPADRAVVRLASPGRPDVTGTTDDEGFLLLRSLPTATYAVEAASSTGSSSGRITGIGVGLNQEIQAQVVLTARVADVRLRTVTYLGGRANAATPVEGAAVSVSGVTSYRGVTPIRSTGTPVARTDRDGWMEVCTAISCPPDPNVTVLPLVEARIDIRASADGYLDHVANDVPTSTIAPLELTPTGRQFQGTLTLGQTADPAPLYPDVRFDVRDAPPGVGQISLAIDDTGRLVWSDSAQPQDGAGRLIRPGFYTIAASLPGYDSDVVDFLVPPGSVAVPQVHFELARYGFLRLGVVADEPGSSDVFDAAATLTLPGGATQRLEAHPGNSFVDFGELAAGTYNVDVRAPGFRPFTGPVVVAPGQAQSTPTVVRLTRLGTVVGAVRSEIGPGVTQAVPGAQVTATLGAQEFGAVTGATGRYSITGTTQRPGLFAGTWHVTATAAGFASGAAGADVAVPAPDPGAPVPPDMTVPAPDVLLTPNPGELVVFAVDGDDPVDGLQLTLTFRDAAFSLQETPDCTPGGVGQPDTCPEEPGVYVFYDLKPLTYNLNVSGQAYSPLTLPVEMGPGQTRQLTVPVTAPSASLQGVVTLQRANGTTVPVVGATVTMAGDGVPDRTADTGADGRYGFTSVAPGTYTVSVTADGRSATRSVALQPGEGVVLDLVLQEQTSSLTVHVTSNGPDLTGALVSLSGPGTAPAAQPVVRTAASTYSTTFAQLAAGRWTARVSGPTGQLGTFEGSAELPDDDELTVAATLTEVRLAATSPAADAPATVTATVTPDGGTGRDVLVSIGGSDTTVLVPDTGARVAAALPGWVVTVAPSTVPAGVAFQRVRITVSPRPTTITVTGAPAGTVVQGDDVEVSVRVAASGGGTVAGSVVLQRSVGSGTWEDLDTAVLNGSAAATLTASTAGWPAGSQQLRVAFTGGGGFAASTVAVGPVTVHLPTSTALSYAAGTLTAVVTNAGTGTGTPTGSVSFQQQSGSTWTAIAGCSAVAVAAGQAACPFAPAAAATARAVFDGSGSWAGSTSPPVAVPGRPPPAP